MKKLLLFLYLIIISQILTAQTEYDEEALLNAGYRTGSDLEYTGWGTQNSVVNNGGATDTNGSNKYCGDIFVPEGKTTLQQSYLWSDWSTIGTFQYSYITTATLPSTITSIGNAAFADCIYLQNIYVSEDNEKYFSHDGVVYEWLQKDESDPFNPQTNKFKLVAVPGAKVNVTILEGTTEIGASAFDGCSKIVAVIIPASVTTIDQYAFTDTNLSSLTLMGNTPPTVTGNNNSHGLYNLGTTVIKVPYGCSDVYDVANRWSEYESIIIEMPQIEEEVSSEATYVRFVEKVIISDSENYNLAHSHTVGDELRRDTIIAGKDSTINIYYSSAASYERTFKNTNWQALYAPFIIKFGDYRTDMMEVARIVNVVEQVDADNNVVWFYISARILDEGEEIPPHTPCLVRSISANAEGVGRDIDLHKGTDSGSEPRVLEAATVNSTVFTTISGNRYSLVGQYGKRTSGEIAAQDGTSGIYAMSGGALKKASSNNVMLGAYRWYLAIEPSVANSARVFKFGNFHSPNNTTATPHITVNSSSDEKYYDLNGRVIYNPVKGVYIHKGKKIYYNK